MTTRLDHIRHCKTASSRNWSNRWTYRLFIKTLAAIDSRPFQPPNTDLLSTPPTVAALSTPRTYFQPPHRVRNHRNDLSSLQTNLETLLVSSRKVVNLNTRKLPRRPMSTTCISDATVFLDSPISTTCISDATLFSRCAVIFVPCGEFPTIRLKHLAG